MSKRFRIIYNQDCTNLFGVTKEALEPGHVDRMVDEAADGGVDLFLVNPNAQRVNYPSRAWQTFWDGYAPGNRAFFGAVPEGELSRREAWVRQMKALADQGCDYLARALARCRQRGITPGVTVRMNDMHDVPYAGSHLFSSFYLQHPGWHLNNPAVCGWSATGLNYEHAEVREHYLALVRELAADYDFDALELDFLRFHCYFPRGDFDRHAAVMTDFMREVRRVLDARPRRAMLTARIPSTPASAYELGLDVAAWAREGLIDAIAPAAFLNTAWNMPVDEFRRATGGRVAIWPCGEATADRPEGLRTRALPSEPELLRGFAAGYLAAGADGLEFFNFFTTREGDRPVDPRFDVLRDLRDLEALRGRPKVYTLTSGWAVCETDGPLQVPVPLPGSQPRAFSLPAAAEPAGTALHVDVLLEGTRPDAARLWLHVNHRPAGAATAVCPFGAKPDAHVATFPVPADALRDGVNTLVLRSEMTEPLTVRSLDLRVG